MLTEQETRIRSEMHRHPGNRALALAFSEILLRRGEFLAGWKLRDRCLEKKYLPASDARGPWFWNGESLLAQTILVFPDEGYGDMIQYFPLLLALAQRAEKVIFLCPRALFRLFSFRAPDNLAMLIWEEQPDEKEKFGADFYCAISSLPGLMEVVLDTLPLARNYLVPDPDDVSRWRKRIDVSSSPRIGVVWAGNPKHINDKFRSIPFEQFKTILRPGNSYFALQMAGESGAQSPEGVVVHDVFSDIRDYADTAALISLLDAVVTVDTSVAHLACAMQMPTHILLAAEADWRWLSERVDSPWYPTARLYRQPVAGNWDQVLDQVALTLWSS